MARPGPLTTWARASAGVGKPREGLSFYASIAHTCCNAERLSSALPAMQDFSYIAITDLSAVDTLSSTASDLVT